MNKYQKDLQLLPNYFKKIAFGIIAFSILLMVLFKFQFNYVDKEIIKMISKSGVLIALLLLVLTKDKIEDELTLKLRLKAYAAAFIYGVIIVIIEPFINFIFDGVFISEKSVTELLFSMFFFYFFIFYLMKRKR